MDLPTHHREDFSWPPARTLTWPRTHNSAKRWGPVHDTLLFYSLSNTFTWNVEHQPYDPAYLASNFTTTDERGVFQDVSLTGPGTREGDSGKPWKGVDPNFVGRHWQPPSMLYSLYTQLTGDDLGKYPLLERLDKADEAGLIFWPKKANGTPRFKQYAHLSPGLPVQDIITDIGPITASAKERLGYPTQKPLALLERIIRASSNEGDVMLDPFCGCGTAVDAAQRLGRRWIGMDISYLSVDLIETRMLDAYGAMIAGTFELVGVPRDTEGAEALFRRSPFDFERWAVSLVDGTPNEKQVGDRGIDGIVRFPISSANDVGKVIVSVKGGNLNPAMVRDLAGTVDAQKAAMGILIANQAITKGMTEAAQMTGSYVHPLTGNSYPKVQLVTVGDLIAGRSPRMPTAFMPYLQAAKFVPDHPTLPGLG